MTRWTRIAMGLALSSAGIVATAEGCGPSGGRYYCDNTGCWQCDGYGCTTVNPPSSNPCTGASGCAQNEVCTDKGCVTKCAVDTDCPKGTVCKSSQCVAPTSDQGTTEECTTKADCKGGTCVANKCVACGGTNGPCPCAATTDCNQGEVCSGKLCVGASSTCKYSSECGLGKVCADGQCVGDCSNGGACASGQVCVKGACAPDPNAKKCTVPTDCPNDQTCAAGACVPKCSLANPCGNGTYCEQGACIPDTRPVPNCTKQTEATDCLVGQQCIGGFCKYTCGTDMDCKLIDARIGYCGLDKVCRTQGEAQAACTDSSQCKQGQSCISNQCK